MPHALQDVTDVLDDPDFYDDTLAYIRRAVEQQPNGSAIGWPGSKPFRGVAIPGDSENQGFEGAQIKGDLTIYTREALTSGDGDTDADLVVYEGLYYRVIQTQNYRFGDTFTVAVCALIDINPSERPNAQDDGFL